MLPGIYPSLLGIYSLLPTCAPPQDCARLFLAFAGIRRRTGGQFHPCNYDVSDVVSVLVVGARQLSAEQLGEVAAAATQFEWPVYRSPVWALDCVAQEAIQRCGIEGGVNSWRVG